MIDTTQKGDTVIHNCAAHHPWRLHVDPATPGPGNRDDGDCDMSRHKRFQQRQFHLYRVPAGQIVEHTALRDDLGLPRQLGVLPE
jgi:hypothetical protein